MAHLGQSTSRNAADLLLILNLVQQVQALTTLEGRDFLKWPRPGERQLSRYNQPVIACFPRTSRVRAVTQRRGERKHQARRQGSIHLSKVHGLVAHCIEPHGLLKRELSNPPKAGCVFCAVRFRSGTHELRNTPSTATSYSDPKHTVRYIRIAGTRFEGLWQG